MENNEILRIEGISKSFASTKALDSVSFSIGPGEIRGLIGENGSGKSTLASIIAGIQQPDNGNLYLYGAEYHPADPVDANENGVSMVMQEIGTINSISVAANIFAGKEDKYSSFGMINFKKMNNQAAQILKNVGIESISPSVIVDALNLEDRKIIEIAKAINGKTRLLIIDETSNALTKKGRDILYKVVNDIKDRGGSVIFITHDIGELVSICDSVTVLRDGRYIDTLAKQEMEIEKLKEMLVGREMSGHLYRMDYGNKIRDDVVLAVHDVCSGVLDHVSLELHSGEILGIGGLSDCGMHELGRIIFGLEKAISGTVTAGPHKTKINQPIKAINNSIGYISKNRDTEALVLQSSIRDNICICSLKKLAKAGIITKREEKRFVTNIADSLRIKMRDIDQYAAYLSGGNKQKVVLAKWLANDTKILVMDCPTRGIDIGVKESIYKLMAELKQAGNSMIMISEELPELIGMSDRIAIMKNGKIKKEFIRSPDITEDIVIREMI